MTDTGIPQDDTLAHVPVVLTKRDQLTNPNSTLNKAEDDEPIFILRARDILAPMNVRMWCWYAQMNGAPMPKVNAAWKVADGMEIWIGEKPKHLPD